MIILPLMINNVCVNVSINFKNTQKNKNQLITGIKGTSTSDIIVGKSIIRLDSNSNPRVITAIIRKNIGYSQYDIKNIQVNTKKYHDSEFYDSYIIETPPANSNDITDYIYGMLVNSIRLNDPEISKKEKISLDALGFDKLFNSEFLNKIASLNNRNYNQMQIRNKLIEEGYSKQLEVLDFFNNLDYEIEEKDAILTDDIDNVISFFNNTKKESKVLTNYKKVALGNYDNYIILAVFNTLVNGKTLDWPILSAEQQKTLQKKLNYKMKVA